MSEASSKRVRLEVAQIYLQMLFDGKAEFMAAFQQAQDGENAVIYDPHFGEIRGTEAISQYYDHCRAWLLGENAVVELKREWAQTTADSTVMESAEFILYLDHGGDVPVPVLLIREMTQTETGPHVSLRIYYSHWPMIGKHCWRKPFLPQKEVVFTGVLQQYTEALSTGSMEKLFACFDETTFTLQQATGNVMTDRETLQHFYGDFLQLAQGGAFVHYCSAVDDGIHCALEYYIDRLGKKNCLPQAGAVVYERSSTADKLISIRLYDDFDPFLQISIEY
ncbi:MAG: hypothetical protein E6713_16015 [Sporomusaceae bacterium]|nr:hypothetical protein [Sporomusaceae bacterium]